MKFNQIESVNILDMPTHKGEYSYNLKLRFHLGFECIACIACTAQVPDRDWNPTSTAVGNHGRVMETLSKIEDDRDIL